jgi:hypothetical protein
MMTHQPAGERVRLGFWIHLAAYVIVVSGLAALNYSRNPDHLWVLWVAGGWGLGIVAHAFGVFYDWGRARLIHRAEARMDRREARHERRAGRHDGTDMTDRMSEASP